MNQFLKGSKTTPLFMGSRGVLDMYKRLHGFKKNGKAFAPLDITAFDHTPTKMVIFLIILTMYDEVTKRGDWDKAPDWWGEIWSAMLNSLFNDDSRVELVHDGVTRLSVKWDSGWPSGLEWTAIFDTILNYAMMYSAQKYAVRYLGKDQLLYGGTKETTH